MRQVYMVFLGFGFCICLYLVVFQGFAAPHLPTAVDALLRFCGALCVQLLALRLRRYYLLRNAPLFLAFLAAVWGLFLFLTSPSWAGATFGLFLADYVTPVLGCIAALLLHRKRYP